ncbi:MAG: hypothetical protein NTV58_12140 [Deltaproteobacteria bacterium]|nr:hypothetical protein [Deltaproteobacteria bacterium]
MDFLKSIAVNLTATGLAAVTIVWLVCVTVLGIYGSSWLSWFAMVVLNLGGAFIVGSLFRKAYSDSYQDEYNALHKKNGRDGDGNRPT